MKAKTIGVIFGAGLLGASAVAASKGKSMHERCKEACAQMAVKASTEEGETQEGGSPSEEGEAHHSCGPSACRK